MTKLTNVNEGLLAGMHLAKTEEINFTSSGDAKVQGWMVKPPDFDPTKKYPLILEIHGGPFTHVQRRRSTTCSRISPPTISWSSTSTRAAAPDTAPASATASTTTIPGRTTTTSWPGVDAAIAAATSTPSGCTSSGCSGGGVLSSWVIGHTDRFAAAAVRCPVIDWMSMTGNTDIPLFTYSFFEKPFWEDPSDWLKHSSVMYVGNVTTPTLLMTGVLDRRTPDAADRGVLRGARSCAACRRSCCGSRASTTAPARSRRTSSGRSST